MTREEKKRYLRRYRTGKHREALILEEIEALRSQQTGGNASFNGMPRGNVPRDLSDYAAQLDELLRQLEAERQMQVVAYQEIHQSINRLKENTEREILVRRYLLGQSWEKIALEMNYSYRHTTKIHRRALENFEK